MCTEASHALELACFHQRQFTFVDLQQPYELQRLYNLCLKSMRTPFSSSLLNSQYSKWS